MQCPVCKCTLSIGISHIEFEGDNAPNTPTVAYNVLPMVCTNGDFGGKPCPNYAGTDLSNPKIVVETLRQKMN